MGFKRTGARGLTGKVPRKTKPVSERLASKLKPNPSTECLEFQGSRDAKGYGRIGVQIGFAKHETRLAHRVAWEEEHGPIPEGFNVLHSCDNPPCCNVKHLFLGTLADNNEDMRTKGRARGNRTTGRAHHNCTISAEQEAAVLSSALSSRKLAAALGISKDQVLGIRRRATR